MTRARIRHSGFTLVEVVVALSILALALGVLYESFGWSLRRSAMLEHRQVALLTAQSLLAEIRGRVTLHPGSERGDTPDGLKWVVNTQPWKARVDEHSPIQPFEVAVEVSWGSRAAQRVRLQSIETSRVGS